MPHAFFNKIRGPVDFVYNGVCDLLAPPYCVSCHRFLEERIPLCTSCERFLEPVVSLEVSVTSNYAMRVYALTSYDKVVRSLVLAKHSRQRIASRQLGELVARGCYCPWEQFDCLVPVPLHWQRYAARGYNQAKVMAERIAQVRGITVSDGVRRVRATRFQATLSAEERIENVMAMSVLKKGFAEQYRGKHVVLIDDVFTTGATLCAVAKAIAVANPKTISALVAARVV
ncbi:MAG: Phosphoribosyltransferase [candidate division TM6 bacterium GW2011_GWE2_42_60]|nr:MAG: Phosphoribosyltransferase [candidate division TM6 bacterium GW2011_GWE2_42_60]HBY05648.1 hypothetical protein [Candidatus Dependentiae bacterium]